MEHPIRILWALMILFSGAPLWSGPRVWQVVIVHDTKEDFALKTIAGFKAALDARLKARGESAAYTQFDTELSDARAAEIVNAIRSQGPDLIFNVNHPTSFADTHVARVLREPKYRFVAENAIPVQSGAAQSWEHPGGNETGVGVFIRFNSQIRLMRMIRPQVSKVILFSWDATTQVNDWYENEVRRAAKEEGIQVAAVQYLPHAEAQIAYMQKISGWGPEYFLAGAVSAWVHQDGTFADMAKIEGEYIQNRFQLAYNSYDEVAVRNGALAGACIIWDDLGAQAADKGLRILDGANPGDLPWEYPRKYNLVLNQATAQRLGITFPAGLLGAAYRVYTNFSGGYIGQ